MECPRCQQDNPPSLKFCGDCGASLRSAGAPVAAIADLQAEIADLRRALGERAQQQAATSEILRIIASSPTDLQPVLQAMAEAAARLCGSFEASIFRLDGEGLRHVAHF